MGKLAIGLLGSFRVALDGTPVRAFESDKVRALLAYLAVEANQAQSREKLAELLWPERPEEHARRSLSQALYNLRTALQERLPEAPPLLLLTPQTIQLNPSSECGLDVAEFARLIEACNRHPHPRVETCMPCQDRFQQAISLYRGDFLADFSLRDSAAFEAWRLAMQERYRLLARRALSSLAGYHEQEGQSGQALKYARRLAELDPLDEGACRGLMRLLAACGKRSEAMACYESYRRLLKQELDAAPDRETKALYEHIRLEEGLQPEVPRRQHNLPASLSPLIGREAELAELQRRLLDPACRLITVLGPGGSGKTRLALEAARGLLENYPHGVYLIPLVPLGSTEAILPTLASTFGLRLHEKSPPLAQVLDYLRQKEILLLMDSFESLLEGVELVLDLLNTSPGLKVLATSRTRLNAAYEQIYPLEGLEYPDSENLGDAMNSAAVRLFASGARRVQPGYGVTADHLKDVLGICRMVGGMPLAILLAACWVDVLSPAEIFSELQHSYDFLKTDWADLPERQRSMRATFDYSWRLMDERERSVFQALSVFRGSFTRQAAEQVSGTGLHELRSLVELSFLQHLPSGRYEVHDLIRQYAEEKLNASPADQHETCQRHCAYYLNRLPEMEAGLKSARQADTSTLLDTEISNVRRAWDWAAGHADIARLGGGLEGLCLYYELRARLAEGRSACQGAAGGLAGLDTPEAQYLLARLAAWESRFCRYQGEQGMARQRLEESQALVDELAVTGLDTREAQAMISLEAGEAAFTADLAATQRHLERSLALYRPLGDAWRTAGVLYRLGINRGHASDYAGSEQLLNEAIELYQKLGVSSGIANAQRGLAQNQVRLGKTESGLALMRKVIATSQTSGDRAQTMLDLRTLALLMMWNGLYDDILPLFHQALSLAQDLGNRYEIGFISVVFGMYGLVTGQYELSRRHLALSLELGRRDGFQREVAASLWSLGCVTLVEKTPQEARPFFQESTAVYRQVGHQDELSWALSLDAFCSLALGEAGQARQRLVEALDIAVSIRGYLSTLFALVVGAVWLGGQGEGGKALEMYEPAARQPVFANSPWFHDLFSKSIETYTAGLPGEIATAARERGRTKDLFEALVALAEELKP